MNLPVSVRANRQKGKKIFFHAILCGLPPRVSGFRVNLPTLNDLIKK